VYERKLGQMEEFIGKIPQKSFRFYADLKYQIFEK
jgi:hypothetical protein